MSTRTTAAVMVLACGVVMGAGGCDQGTPAPGGGGTGGAGGAGGSGNPVANIGENPSSLPGRSAKTAKDAVRAVGAAQDAAVGTAQEMSGEAEAVSIAGLAWSAPTAWQKMKPANAMRAAEFKVPSKAGNGEAGVTFFAGLGGDAASNIERWRGQFSEAGGGSPEAGIVKRKIAATTVTLVTIKGMARGGQPGGPGDDTPNYGMRAAIVDGPQGTVIIKFLGPDTTLTENEAEWMTMVNGMRRG